jgi:hypothetical protein
MRPSISTHAKVCGAILFLPIFLFSQGLKLNTISVQLNADGKTPFRIPFQKIIVIDKRFDTSKIGYIRTALEYKKLVLDNGFSTSLEHYLNKRFEPVHNNRNLVVFIKALYLQGVPLEELTKETNSEKIMRESQCILKADIYSCSENIYQALVRIDTLFNDSKTLKKISDELLSLTIDNIVQQIQSLNTGDLLSRKSKIKEENVFSYYDQRFTNARIKNDSAQKGIYLSFADFINNRPTLLDFTVVQEKKADYLYLKENGKEKLFTDFWGFCDGKDHFVKVGYNFFKLVKDGSTYSFWGCLQAIHTTKRYTAPVVQTPGRFNATLPKGATYVEKKFANVLRPMQLDMDTGEPY